MSPNISTPPTKHHRFSVVFTNRGHPRCHHLDLEAISSGVINDARATPLDRCCFCKQRSTWLCGPVTARAASAIHPRLNNPNQTGPFHTTLKLWRWDSKRLFAVDTLHESRYTIQKVFEKLFCLKKRVRVETNTCSPRAAALCSQVASGHFILRTRARSITTFCKLKYLTTNKVAREKKYILQMSNIVIFRSRSSPCKLHSAKVKIS